MELEYNPFWFTVLILVGFFFISLAIYFSFQIVFSESDPFPDLPCQEGSSLQNGTCISDQIPNTYKECINSELPPYICDIIFPPINQQNV